MRETTCLRSASLRGVMCLRARLSLGGHVPILHPPPHPLRPPPPKRDSAYPHDGRDANDHDQHDDERASAAESSPGTGATGLGVAAASAGGAGVGVAVGGTGVAVGPGVGVAVGAGVGVGVGVGGRVGMSSGATRATPGHSSSLRGATPSPNRSSVLSTKHGVPSSGNGYVRSACCSPFRWNVTGSPAYA